MNCETSSNNSSLFSSLRYNKYVRPHIAFFVILMPLIADILTGLFDLILGISAPFGALWRVLLIIWGVSLLRFNSTLYKLTLLIIIFLFSLLLYWHIEYQGIELFSNIRMFSFLLLPLFILSILYSCELDNTFINKLCKALSYYGFIAGLSILLCFMLGIGYESYGEYAFGFKGVFISGNDIGICILISSSFSWYRFIKSSNLLDLSSAFVSYIALLFIASRTSVVVGTLIVLSGLFVYLFFTNAKDVTASIIKVFVSLISLSIFTVVIWFGVKYADEIFYHVNRLMELLDGVSPREQLDIAFEHVMSNSSLVQKLFGQGTGFFTQMGEAHYLRMKLGREEGFQKLVERDFHDMLGMNGLFFTLFYSCIVVFLAKAIFLSVVQYRTLCKLICFVLFGFFVIHAIFAGHIIFGSQVPILVAVVVCIGISTKIVQSRNYH